MDTVKQLVEQKIMSKPIPIKKQTLEDKYEIIENFDQCLQVYNDWESESNKLNRNNLSNDMNLEKAMWRV